ncbi:MAG: exonuclease subunit SbcD [Thaumarchaeota archaeon]|nr:exonuclease subunit SbcD [Nitrososphaerota archaeon]
MKLLHTSDWHLGKSLGNISRHPEQVEALNEICEVADQQQVDAVIVAGDLFDTFNPPVESVELFYRTLKRLANDGKRVVIAIAGNHDSPERIESPDPLARECGIIFLGYPNTKAPAFSLPSGLKVTRSDEGFLEVLVPGQAVSLRLITMPYANERRLRSYLGIENPEMELRRILEERWKSISQKYCDSDGVNVLAAHLYVTSRTGERYEEPDDEKPILDLGGAQAVFLENIPDGLQYVALGHLHRRIKMQRDGTPVIYSGSPLSYSLNEADQEKAVTIVEVEPGKDPVAKESPLQTGRRVYRKTFDSVTDAIGWLEENPNTLVELTIVSDTFLTADQRKALYSAHDGIVGIIPQVKNAEQPPGIVDIPADLSKSVEELFKEYFKHEKSQDPNEEIIKILREVMKAEEE